MRRRRSDTGYRIPFNRPCFQGKELAYIAEAIHGGQISGNGTFTQRCQAQLSQHLGNAKVILTTSCTDALEMAALLLDLAPGDEVIMPTFTFVSTANAFALRGARPVFVDIRPDTLNLDESLVAHAVTHRTKAIVAVHYAGVGCEMEALSAFADRNDLWLVEDNAHGLFGRFAGRPLGTFGELATLSFHETKNFTCGEGGALVVNANEFAERAEILRDKGTNRARFFRGEVDKYSWVDVGSSFLPSDILAAFLLAQIEARARIQAQRKEIWEFYAEHLRDWADGHRVVLPTVPAQCEQAYHMFYLLLPSLAARKAMIEHLRGAGILAVFHYTPLHLSAMGMARGGKAGDCPVAEDVAERLLRLPFYNDFTEDDQKAVVVAITSCTF
jgi:dTDP-4-amino-4,6-dideoxygalactose transaminase